MDGQEASSRLERLLEPGEQLRHHASADDVIVAVTDRRLVVATHDRVRLAVPIAGVRRIQFDIERSRPATMVIVPEDARFEAQVITVQPREYPGAATALVSIGQALASDSRPSS